MKHALAAVKISFVRGTYTGAGKVTKVNFGGDCIGTSAYLDATDGSIYNVTGKGEYGEGDVFIGVTVPDNRAIAKKYYDSTFSDISEMMKNQIHEIRLSALLALVIKFKKKKSEREEILKFYIDNCSTCNNWDLVDLSAPYILGEYMVNNPMPELLEKLSESENFWKQRIAIVSTLTLIRHGRFTETLKLAEKYLNHHRAPGWTPCVT